MKKSIALLCAASVSLLALAPAAHAEVKVGTVDMNSVFSSYKKTKDAESRINEARASAKKELDERMANYKTSLDEVQKLDVEINKPELSKDAKDAKAKTRDERVAEIKNLEREITEFRQTREKQLQEQAVRMRNGIVEEITKIVQDRVKSENYDIVFDKSGSSLNGVPIVLFANDAMDFSDTVIAELNKGGGGDEKKK